MDKIIDNYTTIAIYYICLLGNCALGYISWTLYPIIKAYLLQYDIYNLFCIDKEIKDIREIENNIQQDVYSNEYKKYIELLYNERVKILVHNYSRNERFVKYLYVLGVMNTLRKNISFKLTKDMIMQLNNLLLSHCHLNEKKYKYFMNVVKLIMSNSIHGLYLEGLPGVGKTHFIQNLAKILNFELVIFNLNNYACSFNTSCPDVRTLNQLIFATYLAKYNNKNGTILFIDEVEKYNTNDTYLLLRFLLQNINPNIKSIYEENLKLNYNIDLPIIVACAGNSLINNPALISRCHILKFEKIHKDIKKEIILDNIKKELGDLYDEKRELKYIENIDYDKYDGVRENIIDTLIYTNLIKDNYRYVDTPWFID